MNTDLPPMYAWQDVPWRRVERTIFKLQKRIYRASWLRTIKQSTVLVTKAKQLRSRMTGNCHVRF